MSKKVHKLNLEPEYSFKLIGISSHENDYRLSWALNNHLNIELTKNPDLEILNHKFAERQNFSLYSFEDEDTFLKYNLLSNTCDNGFLIEEMKNIDFFLQVFGEVPDSFMDSLNKQLKSVDVITATFIIDPNNLKSKSKLIY